MGMHPGHRHRSLAAGALLVALASCSILPRSWTRRTELGAADLQVDNPVVKIRALHQLVGRHDGASLPRIIELMGDEDASVRGNAYWAVTQLTGLEQPTPETPEFNPFDPPEARERIIGDWRHWLEGRHP
jgi:hypothetical protein